MRLRKIVLLTSLLFGCAAAGADIRPEAANSFVHSQYPAGMIPITDIDAENLAPVSKKVDELVAAGEKTVMFRINSYGGEVDSGWDFIQHMEDVKRENGVKTICVADARAMSMGAVFFQSICDERLLTGRSILMFHGAGGQFAGKTDALQSDLSAMEATNEAIVNTCSARLKITPEEYSAHVAHQDWYLAPSEALRVGAADAVVTTTDLPKLFVLEKPKMDLMKMLLGGEAQPKK